MILQFFFLVTTFIFLSCVPLHSEEISPLHLVVPERADLMAKYIYAKHRSWNTTSTFGKDLYYHHLRVWNHFWEDDPPKRGFDDYLYAFNHLLDSVKDQGFNPAFAVPLDTGGTISNGAHRVAACLLYRKNVVVQRCSDPRDYGFDFFQQQGLEAKYLDAMALQYCELKRNTHIMVVFPSAVGNMQEVENIIIRYAKVIYKTKIDFTALGGVNLILTLYDGEQWLGNPANDFSGGRYKAQLCFPNSSSAQQQARVYLVESHLERMQACKQEIRSLFDQNPNTVHATDTHQEAVIVARSLFNHNSVHCLNHRKDFFFPNFEKYLKKYRKMLERKENDWFCLDSGAVLAAYGLRDCADFDVLHYDDNFANSNGIESHNSYLQWHVLPLDDILFNPDYHFFYRGIKFCSLSVIKQMKMHRAEPKDFIDVSLIDQVSAF